MGTYPITYANLNGKTLANTAAKRTVNVIVVPDGAIIQGPDSVYMGAKVYTVTEAKALATGSETVLYAAQGANVVSRGTPFTIDQMVNDTHVNGQHVMQTIDDADWDLITKGTLGTYDSNVALLNASDTTVIESSTGKVTVVPDGAVVNGTDAAYGKTVTLSQTQAKALSGQTKTALESTTYNAVDATYQGLRLSDTTDPTLLATVKANISDGDWAKVTSGTIGSYDSNYTCGAATTTGVKVIVVSDDTVVNGNNSITASNTIVKAFDAKNVLGATGNTEGSKILFGAPLSATAGTQTYNTVSGYVNGVAATAENDLMQTIAPADWTSITSGTLGTYNVSYSAGTGTAAATKAVTVTVVPDDSVVNGTNSAYAGVKVYTQTQAKAFAKTDLYAGQSDYATSWALLSPPTRWSPARR